MTTSRKCHEACNQGSCELCSRHVAAMSKGKATPAQEGVVSSGNSLSYSKEDWDQMTAIGAAVKEMEAAGISWVAHLHDVPFIALKSITDIVDGDRPAQEEFLENLHSAAKALQVCAPSPHLC